MILDASETRRRDVVLVFVLCLVIFAYFMPQWADWNIDSRLDLVHAIVDNHSLSIDRFHYNTWDKAVYKGHFYSDKAPGTAMLGVPVYALFVAAHHVPGVGGAINLFEKNPGWNVAVTLGQGGTQKKPGPAGKSLAGCQRAGTGNVQYIPWGNRLVPPMRDWALSKYVVTIGVDGVLSASFAAFLFWFLGWFAILGLARWLAVGLYSLATVALPYSSNFYSHQLAAAMLFVSFGLVFLRGRGKLGRWVPPVAGFLLGFALFTEYTVAIIIVILAIYALWRFRRDPRGIGAAAIAGAVPVAALLVYNAACFGSPTDTGYSHDFCWSPAQSAGFAGFTYPHSSPLFDLTFGPYRGLFYMSPYLLLAALGAFLLWRRGLGPEALVCVGAAIVFIVTLSAYWGWNGGRVDGPRYLVPAVPFLAFPAAVTFPWLLRSIAGRLVLFVLGAASCFVTWSLFITGDTFPLSWLRNPLVDYSLPALRNNVMAPNAGLFFGLSGWTTLLPLLLVLALVLLVAWVTGRAAQAPIGRDRASPVLLG